MNLLSFETFFNQRHIMKDNVNFDLDTTNAATRKFRVINVHLRLRTGNIYRGELLILRYKSTQYLYAVSSEIVGINFN